MAFQAWSLWGVGGRWHLPSTASHTADREGRGCWGERKLQGKLSSSFSSRCWSLGQHPPRSEASHYDGPQQEQWQPSHAGAKTRATSFQGCYSKTLWGAGFPNKDLPNKLRELLFIHSIFQAQLKSRWSLMFTSHGTCSLSTIFGCAWNHGFGYLYSNCSLPVVFMYLMNSTCKWHTDLILPTTTQQEIYPAWAVYELPFCLRLVFLNFLWLALSLQERITGSLMSKPGPLRSKYFLNSLKFIKISYWSLKALESLRIINLLQLNTSWLLVI